MTMHQHVEKIPTNAQLFESFYRGWDAAARCKPCNPVYSFAQPQATYYRRQYIRGWSARRAAGPPDEGTFAKELMKVDDWDRLLDECKK